MPKDSLLIRTDGNYIFYVGYKDTILSQCPWQAPSEVAEASSLGYEQKATVIQTHCKHK